jgi:hypothetical protein
MILRIYKRNTNNKNELTDIDIDIDIVNRGTNEKTNQKNIKRYLNLIKATYDNKIEVYTEHYDLLYEDNEYIVVSYEKILQDLNTFPNLKTYDYDKNINNCCTIINNEIKLIKESIMFLEILVDDKIKESYLIKTLLDQIKQQILNHK